MGCEALDERTKTSLVLAFGGFSITAMWIISSDGMGELPSALLSGAIVAALAGGGYWLYKCNFNLVGCTGTAGVEALKGVGCGLFS